MDDRLKQSVSALMDGEVNELELRRILSHADHGELSDSLQRYYQVRDVLQNRHESVLGIDVRAAVFRSIEQDPPGLNPVENLNRSAAGLSAPNLSAKTRLGGYLTIAASIVFALVFVTQNRLGHQTDGASVMVAELGALKQEAALPNKPDPDQARSETDLIVELNEVQAGYFNTYLLRHSEHSALGTRSSVTPLVRVASVNSVGI